MLFTSVPQLLFSSVESLMAIYFADIVGGSQKPVSNALLLENLARDALARKAAKPESLSPNRQGTRLNVASELR